MEQIILPHANNKTIPIQDLIAHFKESKIEYMIIGSNKVILSLHPKPKSLDVWIRTHKNVIGHANTCQSVNNVVSQLIKNKSFSLGLRKCPKSKRICKSLVFCDRNN
ncbi:hypothetical protein [Flavobacterium sp.]|jgi:hypothetical protein|uniref:hypothetical protein n=1 Tax=Flavobacterium sp. TaxID=239 RepID=UPI0037C18CAF